MGTNLETLEGLVERAARRIGELTEDNRKLAAEVHSLRQRVAESGAAHETASGWQRERSSLLAGLRQALSELREGA